MGKMAGRLSRAEMLSVGRLHPARIFPCSVFGACVRIDPLKDTDELTVDHRKH
jgi:hypothetical protein